MAIKTYFCKENHEMDAYLNKRPGKDAGYDLFVKEDQWVWPLQTKAIKTNARIHIPRGLFGRVSPRSGNSKRGWLLHPGTVDHGYSGVIGAIVTNIYPWPRKIRAGERIAQLIFIPFQEVDLEEISDIDRYIEEVYGLSQSDRKQKAYNSSGQ